VDVGRYAKLHPGCSCGGVLGFYCGGFWEVSEGEGRELVACCGGRGWWSWDEENDE